VTPDSCAPQQLSGAPEWDILRREIEAFCGRTHTELKAELAKYEQDAPERDVIEGAIEFSAEVPEILERSEGWRDAWSTVAGAGGSALSIDRRKLRRNMGRSQMMNYVVLAIQTGQVRDFKPSLRIPKSLRSSESVFQESRRKARAKAELRRRARGLSATDVDRLIDEIWMHEGIPTPDLPQRHILIEAAMNPPSQLEQLRTTADVLVGGKRWVSHLVKTFRSGDVDEVAENHLRARKGHDAAPVLLDAGVDPQLATLHHPWGFSSRSLATLEVQLRRGDDGVIEVWDSPSSSEPIRLGVIESADAGPFLPLLDQGEATGRVVSCHATRLAVPPPDGPQRLYVSVPSPDGDGKS